MPSHLQSVDDNVRVNHQIPHEYARNSVVWAAFGLSLEAIEHNQHLVPIEQYQGVSMEGRES
jgi:hypothetical protein